MKNTAPEETLRIDPELDDALAAMAEEVPPMPADFHDRWMSAVRAEAEKNAPADKPVPEESPSKAPVSLARWTRILSVAAVFVFLIGGTLLYRNSKKTLSLAPAAEMSHAVMAGGEAPAEDGGAELRPEAPAVMGITDAEEAAQDMAMEAAYEEAAMAAAPAEEAETDGAAPALFAVNAAPKASAKSAGEAYETSAAEEAAYEEDAEEANEAMADGAAEAPAAVPAATVMPTAAPTQPPAVPEKKTETAVETRETGLLQDAGAFLSDMGDFLLASLPYLAVLAVPALVALIFRRRKKRG